MIIHGPPLLSDPLFDTVMQATLDAIVICQSIRDESNAIVDFQVVRCNEQAATLTGFTVERMMQETMLTLSPDRLHNGLFETYRQVVETGLPTHVTHYFADADIWMTQSLVQYGDGVIGSWADITPLKRVEYERQQEAELRATILENIRAGVAVMTSVHDTSGRVVDFRFTHLNAVAGRITGRQPGDLINELYSVAWPEARTNGVLDWHIQVAETGETVRLDGVLLTVGTHSGWYNIQIRPFRQGVIATFTDITALKKAELLNLEQTDLLRSVLDSSSNAIIALTAVRDQTAHQIIDFRYTAHNEANRQNMNGTDETILGQTLLTFFPNMVDMGLFDRFVNVVESGEADRFEQEFMDDGWAGWYEISALKWSDGMVLTLVNITASKTRQQELELANRNLLYANENLQQFARVASHDLQEPLRKIVAFGDLLHGQFAAELGDSGSDMISRMQSAAQRMSDLIRDVLAYSRVSTHRESLRPVALSGIINDVQFEFQNSFDLVNLRLEVDELPTLRCDRVQIKQLFAHLFANALKFRASDRPASLHISCRTMAGTVYPDLLNPAVTYCEISFADNGIGFDNKYADQIFQVFQRLHTRQQYVGTGVGLAICKRITDNHHGAIIATAIPDEGATFRVYLPK